MHLLLRSRSIPLLVISCFTFDRAKKKRDLIQLVQRANKHRDKNYCILKFCKNETCSKLTHVQQLNKNSWVFSKIVPYIKYISF